MAMAAQTKAKHKTVTVYTGRKNRKQILRLADLDDQFDPDNLPHEIMYEAAGDWLIIRSYGAITVKQELFAWRVAWNAKRASAYREVYSSTASPSRASTRAYYILMNCDRKVFRRVQELQDMHRAKVINLESGPWKYYGKRVAHHPLMKLKPYPILTYKKMVQELVSNQYNNTQESVK